MFLILILIQNVETLRIDSKAIDQMTPLVLWSQEGCRMRSRRGDYNVRRFRDMKIGISDPSDSQFNLVCESCFSLCNHVPWHPVPFLGSKQNYQLVCTHKNTPLFSALYQSSTVKINHVSIVM